MVAELSLNISPFQAGLNKAEKSAQQSARNLATQFKTMVGAYFGYSAFSSTLRSVFAQAGKVKDLADQIEQSTDSIQKWGAAFEGVGLTIEDASTAFLKLLDAKKRAMEGDAGAVDAFNLFGVGGMVAGGEAPEQIFLKIGAAMKNMKLDENTARALKELFGKSGPRMADALRDLDGDHGSIISKTDLENIEAAEEAIKRLKREWFSFLAGPTADAASGGVQFLKELEGRMGGTSPSSMSWLPKLLKEFWSGIDPSIGTEAKGLSTSPLAMPAGFMGPRRKAALQKHARDLKAAGMDDGLIAMFLGVTPEDEPQAGPKRMVNPRQLLELGRLQAQVKDAMEGAAFSKLRGSHERIAVLKKKHADIDLEIADQGKQQLDDLYTKEVREENLLRLKLDQLAVEKQIVEMQRSNGASFEEYRSAARAGGIGQGTMAAVEKLLASIDKNTANNGRGTLILGGR